MNSACPISSWTCFDVPLLGLAPWLERVIFTLVPFDLAPSGLNEGDGDSPGRPMSRGIRYHQGDPVANAFPLTVAGLGFMPKRHGLTNAMAYPKEK